MTTGRKIFKFIFKFIIIVIVIYILIYALMLTSCSKTKRYDDVTKFAEITNEVNGAHSHIPELNELGEYESVNLFHNETKQGLWIIDSLTLKVRYDAVKFEKVLNDINSKYFFLKEKKEDLFDCYAIVDGYEIQVVDKSEKMQDDYSYDYPKCFMMIGVNRQERTIVYLYHYDSDLDYIDDLDKFIDKYYILD